MPDKTLLADIVRISTTPSAGYDVLRATFQQYKQLLLQVTGFDMEATAHRENINTPKGMALGPSWAVMCIDDFMRTKYFVEGLVKAVSQRLEQQQQVHILYAGCGPFASLFLPLTSLFSPEQLQCTLLEINPISLAYARQTIATLDISAYIHDSIEMDASNGVLPELPPTDILLTETMQRALVKEHQVFIVANLLSQLPPTTLLIPENIQLTLALRAINQQLDHYSTIPFRQHQPFMALNADGIRKGQWQQLQTLGHFQSDIVPITIPETATNDHAIFVLTDITIYDDVAIGLKESGLSLPVELGILAPGDTKEIQYVINGTPAIHCRPPASTL
jgi:hypothetical protein